MMKDPYRDQSSLDHHLGLIRVGMLSVLQFCDTSQDPEFQISLHGV